MTFQEARPSAPDGDRLQSLSLLRSEESDFLGILLFGPIGHDRADSPRGHRASLVINRRHGLLGSGRKNCHDVAEFHDTLLALTAVQFFITCHWRHPLINPDIIYQINSSIFF